MCAPAFLHEHVDRLRLVVNCRNIKGCAFELVSSVYIRPLLDRRPQDINVPLVSRRVYYVPTSARSRTEG